MKKKASKKKPYLKKKPGKHPHLKASAKARKLLCELDDLGEQIKEYAYKNFKSLSRITSEASAYINNNGTFHDLVVEYDAKMKELVEVFPELKDADKY
jgi:hypothetical protein